GSFSVDMTFRGDKRPITTAWPADVVADVLTRLDNAGLTSPPPAPAAAPARTVAAA
ncbi:hypothetical protein MNEG_9327, partial [Monoraphidium neglectum]